MMLPMILSLALTVAIFIISLLFKIAGKFKLTLPLIYLLLTGTVLNKWASDNEALAFIILFLLYMVSLIRWLSAVRKSRQEKQYYHSLTEDMHWQIERAKEQNIPLSSLYFDNQGNLRFQNTNEFVI